MRKNDPRNARILAISDMHVPYHHPDTFAFLEAAKKKYKPTRVVCLGDEVDHHDLSFHNSDPDLMSAGHEIEKAVECLKELYSLFPVVDLIESNHGSMAYRKALATGIPKKYIRPYHEVLSAPKGWKWHLNMTLRLPTGEAVFFHHGLSKDIMKVVMRRGMCVVQGHYHTEFRIAYAARCQNSLWGMAIGCSIDDTSMAFAYNKTNLETPLLGHGIIIDGHPKLLPMVLNAKGRWDGKIL